MLVSGSEEVIGRSVVVVSVVVDWSSIVLVRPFVEGTGVLLCDRVVLPGEWYIDVDGSLLDVVLAPPVSLASCGSVEVPDPSSELSE